VRPPATGPPGKRAAPGRVIPPAEGRHQADPPPAKAADHPQPRVSPGGDSGPDERCSYCGREGQPLGPCCPAHPDVRACLDVAGCRDDLLAQYRRARDDLAALVWVAGP
jgi:hypothetical protein